MSNLISRAADAQIIATVPDLICVIDAQNGQAMGSPDYKYGRKVVVLGITAAPQWTDTERGLSLGDMRAFGCVSGGSALITANLVASTICPMCQLARTWSHQASSTNLVTCEEMGFGLALTR